MKKKSIEYIFNKIFGVNEKSCDVIGCKNPGGYEAPKSPNSKEKYSFCLSHVKEYNKRWNFFLVKAKGRFTIIKEMTFLSAALRDHFLRE